MVLWIFTAVTATHVRVGPAVGRFPARFPGCPIAVASHQLPHGYTYPADVKVLVNPVQNLPRHNVPHPYRRASLDAPFNHRLSRSLGAMVLWTPKSTHQVLCLV